MSHSSFEEWFTEMASLARENQELFEQKRRELIAKAIEEAAPENRLRLERLQWRIDRERERAKTPLAATIRLYDMLMEMVYGEVGLLQTLETLKGLLTDLKNGKAPREVNLRSHRAKVISFPSKSNRPCA